MRSSVLVEQGLEDGLRGFNEICTVSHEIVPACAAPTSVASQCILESSIMNGSCSPHCLSLSLREVASFMQEVLWKSC